MIETDIAIIGAGPAGMMAAIYASCKGAKTIIIESNTTTGLKLLRTGGGRCNITHNLKINDFVKVFGDSGKFLRYCLHDFSPEKTMEFFEKNGLKIMTEDNGCCYPVTNRATDVKRVLVDAAESFDVKFLANSKIEHIEKEKSLFIIQAPKEMVIAKALIIATGGVSWPQTGSDGDGYKFAKVFGHKIVPPKAALVPLKTSDTWMHKLTGVSLGKAALKAKFEDKKFTTIGPILFTDNGIGGPAVLDFSRHITEYINSKANTKIKVDLLPDWNAQELEQKMISLCNANPRKEIPGILSELLPRRLALSLCEQCSFLKGVKTDQLLKQSRQKLVQLLKSLPITVTGTRSINEATVTKGGICTDEIDDKTMQSKLCPGLFFAGEVMDVDGPCGGFNLQVCWSTGTLAGVCADKHVKQMAIV